MAGSCHGCLPATPPGRPGLTSLPVVGTWSPRARSGGSGGLRGAGGRWRSGPPRAPGSPRAGPSGWHRRWSGRWCASSASGGCSWEGRGSSGGVASGRGGAGPWRAWPRLLTLGVPVRVASPAQNWLLGQTRLTHPEPGPPTARAWQDLRIALFRVEAWPWKSRSRC